MKKSYELNWFPKLRLGYVSLLERFSAFFHSCSLGFLFKFLSEILSYSYRRFYPRFKQFFPEKFLENIAGFLKSKYCLLKVFMRILQIFFQRFSHICSQSLSLDFSSCVLPKQIFVEFILFSPGIYIRCCRRISLRVSLGISLEGFPRFLPVFLLVLLHEIFPGFLRFLQKLLLGFQLRLLPDFKGVFHEFSEGIASGISPEVLRNFNDFFLEFLPGFLQKLHPGYFIKVLARVFFLSFT